MTGAHSPVTALSSTEAMPSTISPSAGMMSLASTRNRSSLRRDDGDDQVTPWRRAAAARSFLAWVSLRVRRRASAWALPRPSATASAKLANSTVNHSQSATAPMNPAGASPCPKSACIHRTVVSTLPTSTTNMTGLRTSTRGSSLTEGVQDGALVELAPVGRLFLELQYVIGINVLTSGVRQSVPSDSAGMKLSAPTMMMTPMSQAMNSGVCVGRVPAPAGTFFLRTSDPAMARAGMASQ